MPDPNFSQIAVELPAAAPSQIFQGAIELPASLPADMSQLALEIPAARAQMFQVCLEIPIELKSSLWYVNTIGFGN